MVCAQHSSLTLELQLQRLLVGVQPRHPIQSSSMGELGATEKVPAVLYIVQCTVYIVQCTMYIVQCTMYKCPSIDGQFVAHQPLVGHQWAMIIWFLVGV